jgi:hypothetical protein
MGEGNDKLAYDIFLSYFEGFFNMSKNFTTRGRRLYFPSKGRRAADLYRPKKSIAFDQV